MKVPILLMTVFGILLAGCLTASASYGSTQDNNPYTYNTGNGFSTNNNHGTCTGGNCGLSSSCPSGTCRNNIADGNSGTSFPCPNGNCGTHSPCPNGNCGTPSPCPNGNCGTSFPCPNGNCGTPSPCPNGNCGTTNVPQDTPTKSIVTTTEPISNHSSNGVTTYTVCVDNNCNVGSDGSVVKITNNDNATDPSYDQLLTFLKVDKTDEHPYIDGQYICVDFAKTLHDNAERSGIKAAFIGCDFSDKSIGHAFNMFNTTDKGIVYIDDTGVPRGSTYEDKILNVAVGQPLTGQYLFKEVSTGGSMGIVKKLYVFW